MRVSIYAPTLLALFSSAIVLFSGATFLNGQAKLQIEIVSFGPHGFAPAELSRPAGAFILSIQDTARLPSLEFSLENGAGEIIAGPVKLGEQISHQYQKAVDLQSGVYTLRIKELPTQVMTIKIL